MARNRKDPALKAAASKSGTKPRPKTADRQMAPKRWQPTFKLSLAARKLFTVIATSARSAGYIKESDIPALTRYAEMLGIWKEAAEALRPEEEGGQGKYIKTPMTGGVGEMLRLHPAFNVLTRTEAQLQGLEAQFGFTPAARYSILAKLAAGTFGPVDPAKKADDHPADQGDLGLPVSPVDFFLAAKGTGPTVQ